MSAASSVTATFATVPSYVLTVNKAGTGAGWVRQIRSPSSTSSAKGSARARRKLSLILRR